jgi:F-type H+-transporting ATPase subunit gamma
MSLYDIKKKLTILSLFQKSTNAMKLLALSSRNQLKKILNQHTTDLQDIEFFMEKSFEYKDNNHHTSPLQSLMIFIGEERSFCGNFTHTLLEHYLTEQQNTSKKIIIGKIFARKLIHKKAKYDLLIENYKYNTIPTIKSTLINYIKTNKITKISLHYIETKSFTENILKHIVIEIDPIHYYKKKLINFYNNQEEIMRKTLIDKLFVLKIEKALYESLYTEQSARYIAMDGALKNTEENIHDTKKLYFKIRQNKINRELEDVMVNLL